MPQEIKKKFSWFYIFFFSNIKNLKYIHIEFNLKLLSLKTMFHGRTNVES